MNLEPQTKIRNEFLVKSSETVRRDRARFKVPILYSIVMARRLHSMRAQQKWKQLLDYPPFFILVGSACQAYITI